MRTLHCLLLFAVIACFAPQAHAVNIIWESLGASSHPDNPAGSFTSNPPAFDADSSGLLSILEEVEREFQAAFEDPGTIRITYWWDNAINGGQSIPSWIEENPTGTLTHSVIRFGSTANYFIDPTPENDSEYAMQQVLFNYGPNALTPTQQTARFTGNVPDVFEAGYNGTEINNLSGDLLTLAFQEVGHSLGMNAGFSGVTNGNGTGEVDDNDYDVDPDWVRNSVMDMLPRGVSPDPLDHLAGNDAVMGNLSTSNTRTRPSAADFFAIALTQGWTDIDLPRQDFLGGTNWSTAGNWMGNQVPGSLDDAYVRSAINGSVLSASLTANVAARNLNVENGSNVDVNSFKLDIGNDVTVTGLDSDIFVNAGGELEADEIFIQDQSEIQMTGGLVDARRLTIDQGAQLEGVSGGSMTIDVSERLVNNGVIDVDGGAVMTFHSAATNAWDLDGAGDGQLFANGGNLIFDTGAVSDAFDGEMNVNAGFFLRIDAPWEFADAVLDMNGGSGGGNSARMVGGTISITGGTIDVDDVGGDGLTDGKAEFDAPVDISGGNFTIGPDDTLDFDNTANVSGGTFTLAQDASLNFDGTTSINGGTFNTFSTSSADGDVEFNGTTTWGGTTTINGIAKQDGNANVLIDAVINADLFDLDGNVGGAQTWGIGADLTINADAMETVGNTYSGTMNINSNNIIAPASLTINLPGSDEWTMGGTLNSTGPGGAFNAFTLLGSAMNLSGTANIVGNNSWAARVDILSVGTLNVTSGAALQLTGGSESDPNTIAGEVFVDGELNVNSAVSVLASADLETNNSNDEIDFNGHTTLAGGSFTGSGIVKFDSQVVVVSSTSIGMADTDLDGDTEGAVIDIDPNVTFSIASTTIDPSDGAFDGVINLQGNFSTIVPLLLDGEINMTRSGGDPVPVLTGVTGFTISTTGTVITTGDANINRDTTVQGFLAVNSGLTQINADAAFASSAVVTIASGSELQLNGVTTFSGGAYTRGGLLRLNGTTTVDADTTITIGRIDLDGSAENTIIHINDATFALMVEAVDATNNLSGGTINVVGENARLAVNLTNPLTAWRLSSDGVLNFNNPAAAPATMLTGSGLSAEGIINGTGRVVLAVNMSVQNRLNSVTAGSDVHFAGSNRTTVHANRAATIAGLGSITIDNGTTVNLENRTLIAVSTENVGRLEIGFEASEVAIDYTVPAIATIRGTFSQATVGELAVDLGGLSQSTEYDLLQIIGTARLNGVIEATLIDDFVPAIGNTFQVLTATQVIGQFDSVETIDSHDVLGFVLTDIYSPTDVMLRIDDVFLIGDYNDDGAVSAADYTIWRDNLGALAGTLPNDIDGGPIGQAQYETWQSHFGNTLPKPGLLEDMAVPEPTSAMLLLVLTLAFGLRLRSASNRR